MKPFLFGKKNSEAAQLRVAPNVAPSTAHGAAHHGAHVEAIKQGDKIVRLIVTCACGERIEVECLYPAGK